MTIDELRQTVHAANAYGAACVLSDAGLTLEGERYETLISWEELAQAKPSDVEAQARQLQTLEAQFFGAATDTE